MTKLSASLQLEKQSRIFFETCLQPWDCIKPGDDFGFDLIVQPYFKEKGTNNEGTPHNKRFLVQLKSTKHKAKKVNKLKVDIKHLKLWKMQKDPVMIIRYYAGDTCSYYQWVNDIEISSKQKYQTVTLNHKLALNNKDKVKRDILDYISPHEVSEISYIPNPKNPNKGSATVSFSSSHPQLADNIFNSGMMENIEQKMQLLHASHQYKSKLSTYPDDHETRYKLIGCYIRLNNFNEAISQLSIHLRMNPTSITSRIAYDILASDTPELIKHSGTISFYLKWHQDTPPQTSIQVTCIINKKDKHVLDDWNPNGVIIPAKNIQTLSIQYKCISNGFGCPVLNTSSVFLMAGPVDIQQGKILHKYGIEIQKVQPHCIVRI